MERESRRPNGTELHEGREGNKYRRRVLRCSDQARGKFARARAADAAEKAVPNKIIIHRTRAPGRGAWEALPASHPRGFVQHGDEAGAAVVNDTEY